MAEQFMALKLKGAYVRDLLIFPKKKLLVGVMIPPVNQGKSSPRITRSYDLQFNKIVDFDIDVSAAPWLEIVSHDVLTQSPLVNRFHERERKRSSSDIPQTLVQHFQIVFDEGKVDILAETCTISLVEELPAFDDPNGPA